jgi:hypothetical protein
MRKILALLALFAASQAHAVTGFSLSGGLHFSPAKIKESEAPGSRHAVWAYNLQLGYEFSSGFGAGVRALVPCTSVSAKLPPDYSALLGQTSAGLAPTTYIGECNLPLLSLGFLSFSASLGAGFADWGAKNFAKLQSQQYSLPGNPGVNVEARLPCWTLAYLTLINVELDAIDLVSLRASFGYTSFGSPVDHTSLKSVLNGVTFGLGASLKLW